MFVDLNLTSEDKLIIKQRSERTSGMFSMKIYPKNESLPERISFVFPSTYFVAKTESGRWMAACINNGCVQKIRICNNLYYSLLDITDLQKSS